MQFIITPVTIVSFLLSLALVDLRYSIARAQAASDDAASPLPRWLRETLYRRSSNVYVRVQGGPEKEGQEGEEQNGEPWHYQKYHGKLVKMQLDEAFELRGYVLAAIVLAMAVAIMVIWTIAICSLGWYRG